MYPRYLPPFPYLFQQYLLFTILCFLVATTLRYHTLVSEGIVPVPGDDDVVNDLDIK